MLYMNGGPSQLDMFDPKPALFKYAGQRPSAVDLRTERTTGGLLPSPFEFKRYGAERRGSQRAAAAARQRHRRYVRHSIDVHVQPDTHAGAQPVPHGQHARDAAVDGLVDSYGLGTENQNLPVFVALATAADAADLRRGPGFCRPNTRASAFTVADSDPEKIIPNLRNKRSMQRRSAPTWTRCWR